MKDDLYQAGQKELPGSEVIHQSLVNISFLEDWLKIWSDVVQKLSFQNRTAICSYEATDLVKTALYEWQGRKERNYPLLNSQIGDLIIQAILLAVEQKVDLADCLQGAVERLENIEFKKSGAKF